MLLFMQPRGSADLRYRSSPPLTKIHYNSKKHTYSILAQPIVSTCVKISFTSDTNMTPMRMDPFGKNPTRSRSFCRLPRNSFGNPSISPGLQTFRRTNEELRDELKYGSARWSDDEEVHLPSSPSDNELDTVSRERCNNSSANTHIRPTDTSSGYYDGCGKDQILRSSSVFKPQTFSATNAASDSEGPAEKFEPSRFLHAPSSSRNSSYPRSSHTQAVDIVQPRKSDPRDYFGIDTHLPWVKKLSPTQFSQTVVPEMLPRGSPPAKSVWEAEDDEFDRWPTVGQVREELATVRRNATLKRNTFVRPQEPELSIAEQVAEAMDTPIGADLTTEEREQLILELEDMDCGNPWGRDAHDDIVAPFRSHAYTVLPANAPARHMHVLDAKAYTSSQDDIVKTARPRLCDAVATILAYTSSDCLRAFLDPEVEVFEWRRQGNCVMIRREGNKVLVGNYYNFGTTYQWGYLVRSAIDTGGAWTETYASVSQGTTPVTKERVMFEEFEAEAVNDEMADNEEFALYVGRELADFLLRWSVWDYNKWWRYKVEWEADGRVTNVRDRNRYPAGLVE